MSAVIARAKPLNALTIAALPVGLEAWDDEIAYLNDTLQGKVSDTLRTHLTAKRDALVRSREWVASKVAAESTPTENAHERVGAHA